MRRRDNGDDARQVWVTWLRETLQERGYDVDSPRGGGKTQLAADLDMAGSSVTRLLTGGSMPNHETVVRLAKVLDVPLAELLVRTGKAAESDFPQTGSKLDHSEVSSVTPMTPEQLAAAAKVPQAHRAWFEEMVRNFMNEADSEQHGGNSTGGAAAGR
ncbi:helix-turn-helix transcriptional regulator [Streptomyces sp. DSM 42041]|uniref:Helix-turn-helix transcriptional regulator n=1 Tax=Streptomyces hazeniae TaxID=3075538 RepID=A0ABU2NWK0_9ACTN|nr:helix-turn-helix transcriptional regulator [Streptomyces sp. DSM 42041]MDT0381371.1 helix-turn-helix transcriptional regulator [Streptomyces sp. DSM 42041]